MRYQRWWTNRVTYRDGPIAMDYGQFEPATETAVWLAKEKRDRSEVDDLNTNIKGLESQLNKWLRERNWKPLIRDMWIEWLRK